MHRRPLLACVLLCLLPATATAQHPAGVEPGESYHRVFVTPGEYGISSGGSFPPPSGFINNLTGADWQVTLQAFGAGLFTGWNGLEIVYTAILSDSTTDANTRFAIEGKVYNTQDEKLADNHADFWDGALDAAIRYDAAGAAVATTEVWTGSEPSGNYSSRGCGDWTDSSAVGTFGDSSSAGTTWLGLSFQFCSNTARLYGISPAETLPDSADFDDDHQVDGADFLTLQRGFGVMGPLATHANGDANGDDAIDGLDLAVWHLQYGGPPPASAAVASVPEPSGAVLSLVAVSLAGRRRR